jgi:hemerythrin-like metal-binding protein
MKRIVWDDKYSVGHAELDRQHQVLVGMINSMIDGLEAGADRQTAEQMLSEVTGYACSHLMFEENLLLQAGYPKFEAHQAEHGKFRRKNGELHLKAEVSGPELLEEILSYLGTWLMEHILVTDMQYKGRIPAWSKAG